MEYLEFNKISLDIFKEIERQDKKWGANRNNHPLVWHSILSEEVGELAKEINESGFNFNNLSKNYKTELVQIAAVCLQAILHYDNNI